jgi:hypothetical protein
MTTSMIAASLVYDPATDQLVVRVPAADGEGDVELLRLDVKQLSADDKRRLRAVRDPDKPQPAPGETPVTRR